MSLEKRTVAGVVVLDVAGRLDLTSVPSLRSELLRELEQLAEEATVLLGLAGVPFMDSSGIATLIEARKIAGDRGLRLGLFGMGEQVRHLFELAGLLGAFEIFDDERAALAGGP